MNDLVATILKAAKKNPAILQFQTCWQLAQAGVKLPTCTMEEADAALRIAKGEPTPKSSPVAVPATNGRKLPVVYHTGCMGDIIAALPIMRELGGVHLRIGNYTNQDPAWQKRNMEGQPYNAIEPLLKAQPYIASVAFEHGAAFDYELEHWRGIYWSLRTLTDSQAKYLGMMPPNTTPWLVGVKPSYESQGRIVIARTERYHNDTMPWYRIMQKNPADRFLFVGSPREHELFCEMYGAKIEHRRTGNLLEVAQLIAGSDCFIGNQSSPCWIAMGLGHSLIQETHTTIQDSKTERDNAVFYIAGKLIPPHGVKLNL